MKITEVMLMKNKELREQCANRIDVLEKVKHVFTIPNTDVMTLTQVAEFYDVPLDTINTCYKRNESEIDSNGVVLMTPKTYKEILNRTACPIKNSSDYTQMNGKMIIHVDKNIDIMIPNRGIKVFPIRAVLNIGMLLEQSTVAHEVRRQLLNIFDNAKQENPELVTREIGHEEELYHNLFKTMLSGNTGEMFEALQNVVDYNNRHRLEMEKKIDEIETANQELETANQVITSNLKVISDRSSLSRVIRCLARVKSKSYSQAWNEFYTFLNYKAHINLKKRGGKPYVNHINDNEWGTIQQVLVGYIEKNNLNATEFLRSCEIVK